MLAASRAWKKTSGFCAVPRSFGAFGLRARRRCSEMSSSSIIALMASSLIASILEISCDVRKPSKKCRNGIRLRSVEACATIAMSCASCTPDEARRAKPVWRADITSEWSPKMLRACVASVRAATCMTVGVSSPAILYMLGIISRRPCDAVNVVHNAPAWRAPWTAPAAPPSLCISVTSGIAPQMFGLPTCDHESASSPIGDAGVIG